jgi:ATP-dependent Clp protease ATP-binding subunit ClpA
MPTRGYRKGISDTKESKPCFVRTRLTGTEFTRFKQEAASRSLTQSQLARALIAAHLANKRVELPHARGMTSQALRELSRIGNNLNQLARQANVGLVAVKEDELRRCVSTLNDLARNL